MLPENMTERQILIYPENGNGYWTAECPSLPGCITQNETRQGVLANIQEAIADYIEALIEDELSIPEEHFKAELIIQKSVLRQR